MATREIVPYGWEREVDAAIDEFRLQTKVSKKRLGQALGINASSLTLSHLENIAKQKYIFHRLLSCLRADNIYTAAYRLHLDFDGWHALKRLSARILGSAYPYLVDPERPLENASEAYELGMLGVEYWEPGEWDAAVSYLQYAWEYFQAHPSDASDSGLYVRLRVGTHLASWQSTAGEPAATFLTAQETLKWAKAYRGSDRKLVEAICWLYNTAGTAWRHAGKHPEFAIEKHRIADKIIVANGLPRTHRIPMLRNQAKPYAQWALRDEIQRSRCFAEALSIARESEQEAGGDIPLDEVREEWLLSRLTRVECLVAMNQDTQAQRLWDETMDRDWVPAMVSRRADTALTAKWEFARMAVTLAHHDLCALAKHARAFQSDNRNAPFGERLQRAEHFAALAEGGEEDTLRAWIIR